MKPPRVVLVLALSVFALSVPASARAALIGLAGGDYDPPPINDPSVFELASCSSQPGGYVLPSDAFCIFYEFADLDGNQKLDPINSIDFRLLDAEGNYIPVFPMTLATDENSELSAALISSPLFDDGFTFRLSGELFGEKLQQIYPTGCHVEDGCELAFFVRPDDFHPDVSGFSGAVVGANGIASPGATRVPEPGTLLLMGPAALGLLAARRRRAVRRTGSA